MVENSKTEKLVEIKHLTSEIIKHFTSDAEEDNLKWSLLETYHLEILQKNRTDGTVISSYVSVLSALVDALKPTLFHEKYQETLFDKFFLQGVPHESFLILVKRIDCSENYALKKVINLLQKFMQGPSLDGLFMWQCVSREGWDLKYVSQSGIWDHFITALVSLPERIANRTQGKFIKLFSPTRYVPFLLSSVFRVLHEVHERVKDSQDCCLEFLAKLTGRLCVAGNADAVARRFSKQLISVCNSNYIWRRMLQNFVCKLPANSLDSFITHLLLEIPWYGYVEWILADEGIKNEKINYIMTVKLFYFKHFKQAVILQNIIGYFASSPSRVSHFEKILNSLLESWADERALKHQSMEQKMYVSCALMVCGGWLKKQKLTFNNKDYVNKVLKGVQLRLESSEEGVRSLGMIIGEQLLRVLDPESPPVGFEHTNADLVRHLEGLLEIPSEPKDSVISSDDLKCFEETEPQSTIKKQSEEIKEPSASATDEDIDSEDDLEPYDLSNDIPESQMKRPLYLRDCMMGMLEQKDMEWKEQCMKHAEELIKANPYAAEEVAEEMTKITLHLMDEGSVPNFDALRHKILIALTVQCPLTVASYLQSQFTEREYTIRQRLDILEVLSASSVLLSSQGIGLPSPEVRPKQDRKEQPEWQIIVHQRLQAKTKHYTKAQDLPVKENKFSAIAGNFFYPLLNSYEKASKILKLQDRDSYVLGRFIYTLGIIMCSASNTLHCREMGSAFLQFLVDVRSHKDVFVRQSAIFATAAILTAVPPSLLFTEIIDDVMDTIEWLQSVAENDADGNCVEKALYTLSIFQNAAKEGSLLYQLNSLTIS